MEEVKKNTVQQGEKAEVIFQHICLVKHNYMVSKPIGTTDYDLVVEVGKKLLKVQVKSTGNQNGSIRVCKGRNAGNASVPSTSILTQYMNWPTLSGVACAQAGGRRGRPLAGIGRALPEARSLLD